MKFFPCHLRDGADNKNEFLFPAPSDKMPRNLLTDVINTSAFVVKFRLGLRPLNRQTALSQNSKSPPNFTLKVKVDDLRARTQTYSQQNSIPKGRWGFSTAASMVQQCNSCAVPKSRQSETTATSSLVVRCLYRTHRQCIKKSKRTHPFACNNDWKCTGRGGVGSFYCIFIFQQTFDVNT